MKKSEVVEREPASLFCEGHRAWIVTQEQHNMFASVDGVKTKVSVWRCPACRGEKDAPAVEIAKAPKTGADISKDERLGPYRDVADVVKVNDGGKTCRVALKPCGHEACVNVGSKGVRCRVCAREQRKAAEGDA